MYKRSYALSEENKFDLTFQGEEKKSEVGGRTTLTTLEKFVLSLQIDPLPLGQLVEFN